MYYADTMTPTYELHVFTTKAERDAWVAGDDDRLDLDARWARRSYGELWSDEVKCHGDARVPRSWLDD